MIVQEQQATPAAEQVVASPVTYLWAAIQFLTRIPTPAIAWNDRTLSRALVFFPLVGLLLGAAGGAVYLGLATHLNHTVAALLAIAAMIGLTGALHEDGLADVADAFGSHHSRQRTLEILRDSRIGTFGGIALVLSIGARILLLAAIPSAHTLVFLASAAMLARWSILPLTWLPSARSEDGLGRQVAGSMPKWVFLIATFGTLLLAFGLLGRQAVAPLLIAPAITWASAVFYKRRLGGVTGDCFGATAQLVELGVLLCGAWIP